MPVVPMVYWCFKEGRGNGKVFLGVRITYVVPDTSAFSGRK